MEYIIEDQVETFMRLETKQDLYFSEDQLDIDGSTEPYRMDIKTKGGLILCVRDRTKLKLMKSSHNKSTKEYFFLKLLSGKLKVPFAYCCHPQKNTLASTWSNSEK